MYIGKENLATSDFPVNRFSGNNSTTDFTLSEAPASVRAILVEIEGIVQDPESAYTLNGTTLSFSGAPPTGTNNIVVRFLGARMNVPTVGDNATITGGSISGTNITVGAAKTLDVSAGTLTLANDQISGDKIHGGTISSFASTGIDDNASTTALTIDNSGNVGIGTTSAGNNLHIHKADSSGCWTHFTNSTTGTTTGDGTIIGIDSAENVRIHNYEATDIVFYTNNSERVRIDSGGLVGIGGSAVATRLHVFGDANYFAQKVKGNSTSGQSFGLLIDAGTTSADNPFLVRDYTATTTLFRISGVGCEALKFAPTQVASSDANTLDDYEEGTFTPTIAGTTTAGTGSYIAQTGIYTKVGNIVHFSIRLQWTSHTGTGYVRIASLPFTAASAYQTVSFLHENLAFTAGHVLEGYVNSGGTTIEIQTVPTGGGVAAGVNMDTDATLWASGSYRVA